jgi:8-oxo-dGTP pyrophosphatase MutT (NUDIX family)
MPEHWPTIDSQSGPSYRIFSLRVDRARAPHTGKEHEFCVVEAPNWVNIIPLTADNQVVMVKQFRHGIKEVTLEIPGGMIENGDSPEEAALRELFEETGYKAEGATLLGVVHPNPAFLTNECYTFFVENVQKIEGGGNPDDAEDIEVELVPLKKIPELIKNGTITNSLVVTAFWWFFADKIDYSTIR